jgi:hypothetical protein
VALGALATCHPFTGVQFLLIALAWMLLERRVGSMPWWAIGTGGAMLGAHLLYYLVFLPRDPDHRSVQEQFTPWGLPLLTQVLAYGPVLLLATAACRRAGGVRAWLATPARRLLAVWLVVSLGLINHDLVLPAHQPVHFTRGYNWSAAFLLGAPALRALLATAAARGPLLPLALMGALLFDNGTWFVHRTLAPTGCFDPPQVREVLSALNAEPAVREALFVADDPNLAYAVVTSTPLRAWCSHYAITPHAAQRRRELADFWRRGRAPPAWSGRELVLAATPEWIAARAGLLEEPRLLVRNDHYQVLVGRLRPSPPAGRE